ncbi:hypothetical protein GCM10020331_038630 [Ectobacillus funiculus]
MLLKRKKTALCTIAEITNTFVKVAVVQWVEERSELPVAITIASGLPKGDKLDLIFTKRVPSLGQPLFLPFQASRSIVKWDSKKRARRR